MTTKVPSSTLANNLTLNVSTIGLSTTSFTIQQANNKILFKYGSNNIMTLDANGNVIISGTISAGGSPA
jgi:hypothetical protein